MNIIVKRYDGYNRSLGKYITSKRDYYTEMDKQGMIPYDKACQIAEGVQKRKPYIVSEETKHFVAELEQTADKKGRIKLGSRAVKKMQDIGCNFNQNNLPKHYQKGGFDNSV